MHKWDWFVKWHFGCGISKIVGFKNWKSSFWHTQKKSLYFVDIGWPFVKFQKVPKSDFQYFFNVKNHPNRFELGAHFLLKVAQWKNDFIKRPHNTENLNFPSPKLRVMPSPSAFSKFGSSILKSFKHAQFFMYTQNHFSILKN